MECLLFVTLFSLQYLLSLHISHIGGNPYSQQKQRALPQLVRSAWNISLPIEVRPPSILKSYSWCTKSKPARLGIKKQQSCLWEDGCCELWKGIKFAGLATSTTRTTYYSYLSHQEFGEKIVLDDVHGFLVFQVSAELPCGFKIVILTEPWFCEEGHVHMCRLHAYFMDVFACLHIISISRIPQI